MSNKTISQLTSSAKTIRDETKKSANTANRVGGYLLDNLNSRPNFFSQNVTITVGDQGDHSNINDALLEASRLYPLYINEGIEVVIDVLEGHVIDYQVWIVGMALPFVTIRSGTQITVNRESITKAFNDINPVFLLKKVFGLRVDLDLALDETGAENSQILTAIFDSHGINISGSKLDNSVRENLICVSSYVKGNNVETSNAKNNRDIFVLENSIFSFINGKIETNVSGLIIQNGSFAEIQRAEINTSGTSSLSVINSKVTGRETILSNVGGSRAIACERNSQIELYDSTLNVSNNHLRVVNGHARVILNGSTLTETGGWSFGDNANYLIDVTGCTPAGGKPPANFDTNGIVLGS